jgi:hypothetical protein
LLIVRLIHIGNLSVLWIAWLSRAEKSLEREEGSLDGQGGGPLVFEDVETDCAGLRRDIGVPNYRRVRVNSETDREIDRYSERQRQRETGTEADRENCPPLVMKRIFGGLKG